MNMHPGMARSSAEPDVSPRWRRLAGARADPVRFTRAADRRDRRGVHIAHADPVGLGPKCAYPQRESSCPT